MKNFKNYLIISLVMVLAILFFINKGVNASGIAIVYSNSATNNTTTENNTTANNTTANNTTTQVTPLTTNVVKTNTINDASKDNGSTSLTDKQIPKTGENDIYVISAIGFVAIVVGIFSYAKSKKYDIK